MGLSVAWCFGVETTRKSWRGSSGWGSFCVVCALGHLRPSRLLEVSRSFKAPPRATSSSPHCMWRAGGLQAHTRLGEQNSACPRSAQSGEEDRPALVVESKPWKQGGSAPDSAGGQSACHSALGGAAPAGSCSFLGATGQPVLWPLGPESWCWGVPGGDTAGTPARRGGQQPSGTPLCSGSRPPYVWASLFLLSP